MSYDTVEIAAANVLKKLDGFDDENVDRGDYRLLGHGKNEVVVLQYGGFGRRNMTTPQRPRTPWRINIELFIPFREDISTVKKEIRTVMQEIMDQYDRYPTLNRMEGVILSMVVDSRGEPSIWEGAGGGIRWWQLIMILEVEERQIIEYAEE